MANIKVKLSKKLDTAKLSFFDIEGNQKISPKEFGKNEVFVVKDTSFVREKIQSQELVFVGEVKEEPKEDAPKKEADKK